MSESFFQKLGIPAPGVNLGIEPQAPSAQTGSMLEGLAEAVARARGTRAARG